MKVLVIHQYYLGSGDSGGSRWNQFARYWKEAGHDIQVIAGTVHYASGEVPEKYRGRYITTQRDDQGITIFRCFVSRHYRRGRWGRLWGILTFAISSIWAGLTRVERPDVIVATSPPLFVGLTMRFLKLWYRCPCVFEIRDLHPDSLIEIGQVSNRIEKWGLLKIEAMSYKVELINALTPAFVEVLKRDKSVAPHRICMISNGADLDIMQPGEKNNQVRQKLGLEDNYVVGYFGAHGIANHLQQLLDAAELMKDQMPDVRLMLVGHGPQKADLMASAEKRGLSNVVFHDAVPKEEVSQFINACDVCTAVLKRTDLYRTVYPNKVFDYMACRRPILLGIDGIARKLVVEETGSGLFVEPENPQAFLDGLRHLRKEPGLAESLAESGHRMAAERYSRRALGMKYLQFVEQAVAQS